MNTLLKKQIKGNPKNSVLLTKNPKTSRVQVIREALFTVYQILYVTNTNTFFLLSATIKILKKSEKIISLGTEGGHGIEQK